MSSITHTTISLPPSRARQLRSIANANSCGITEAIELLINREINAGRLADALPGFEIKIANKHVWFVIGEIGLPPLVPAHARAIAAHFLKAANGGDSASGLGFGEDEFKLVVARKGRGIIVRALDIAHERESKASMTPGMARDLARQLVSAANTIQGLE